MLGHVRCLLGVAIITAPALAGPLSTGEWLVHLGRDYPLSAQASLTNADAHITLLLMQAAGRVEPALPEAWYWQADLLFALDQPDQARAALAEYVRRAPDDVAAHLRLIERATDALQTAEERAVAWRQSLKDAAALPREVRSDLHRRLAEFHANRGERQQALAEAQAALADFGMNFAARQLLDQLQGVAQTPAWRLEWALAEMVVNPADAAQAVAIGDLLTTLGLVADAEFWYGHAERLRRLETGEPPLAAPPAPASRPAPGTQPAPPEVRAMLEAFPRAVLDYPLNPSKYLSLTWQASASDLPPAEPWRCTVRLTNVGPFPVTFGEGRMILPELVAAITTRGDQERTSGPTLRLSLHRRLRLLPGESLERTWTLDLGAIRASMIATPQMIHQVEVAGVLSPVRVELSDGREAWLPAIGGLTAPPLRFRRSAWAVSPERMRSLLRQAQSPAVSDRITAMEILSMLLGEQQHLAAGRLRYAAVPIDAGQVQQAILARSADADWSVRARLAECLRWFVLDTEATRAAANLLTDDHWLVRGLALRLFADQHKDSFLPALRQIAGADPDEWVRRMARALADRMPPPATQPTAPTSTASP